MIKVLPDHVVNQISAGEVVERPASVVRELVDNALDAGASEINIEIEDGGRSLVRVSDNGCGMSRDDAPVAFSRHATSKLQSLEDLNRIASLGFRGEALPSIASVSKVRLVTRRAEDSVGTEVLIEGGALKSVSPAPAQAGSVIEVRSLFFNTPARRKFLKLEKTEELRVKHWVLHSSVVHPRIRYRLYADGKEILNLPPREHARARAGEIFRGSSVSLSRAVGPLTLEGLLLHPSLAQGESASCLIFVNQRMISDRTVLRAIRDGFSSTLKDREFPVGFLSIELLSEFVDVNVHPQKSEVRFSSSQAVFTAVRDAVREAVVSFKGPVQSFSAGGYESLPNFTRTSGSLEIEREPSPQFQQGMGFAVCEKPLVTAGQSFRFSDLAYIGQALKCYLFCQYAGAVYVVDMHAAHERYNYNLVRRAMLSGRAPSQKLLVPAVVRINEESAERCLAHQDWLGRAGFEIQEGASADCVSIMAVPSVLGGIDPTSLIKELAAYEMPEQASERFAEALDHIAARIACHASVRSGQDLSREEVYALFSALDQSEFSSACPHGRPIVVSFEESAIERWFGRDR